jgi:anti-sigma regulatory factor (Ser/Thr protein kinase)
MVVADQGPGIPNLDLAMQEGWSTASPKVREMGYGAGMGLPNIKKNTDDLKIDTEVGVGTTVTMTVYLT